MAPSTPFTTMSSFMGTSNTPISTASSRLSISHIGASDHVVSQQMVSSAAQLCVACAFPAFCTNSLSSLSTVKSWRRAPQIWRLAKNIFVSHIFRMHYK
jgi:hypothetical protein